MGIQQELPPYIAAASGAHRKILARAKTTACHFSSASQGGGGGSDSDVDDAASAEAGLLVESINNNNNNNIISNNTIVDCANEREREARRLWRAADAVCFDVDSTVCQNEAIDDFAEFLGVSDEVAKCTRDAMGGQMTFREALRRRLDLMKPTRQQLAEFKAKHAIRLTPGIVPLVAELQRRRVDVYLVSGGFRPIIRPVADILNIAASNIYANEILFDQDGNYAGFDVNELTSDSGAENVGKAGVCALLKAKKHYKTLIMVGDGATDAEASPPADAFVGFGGNQVRDAVRKLADWYVHHFDALREELRAAERH